MDEWIATVVEHDGLVLRDRALHAGIDPDLIMKALRTGRLRRIQRCVYIRRYDEISPLALARAALLTINVPEAVASHQTAARVHRIPIPDGRAPEHVTVPHGKRRIRRRELICHARSFAVGEVEVRDGVPLTVPARTLVDLADVVPRLHAVWAVDDSLRRGLVTRENLAACLDDRGRGRGNGVARQLITEADGVSESILETAGRLALADARLPLPTAQFQVFDGDDLVARLDGGYPQYRLGLEFDGKAVHGTPKAVFRDRWRQNRLLELGWNVLRFTWWDVVHDPTGFVAAVRGALRQFSL
jgi:hypothetical protein